MGRREYTFGLTYRNPHRLRDFPWTLETQVGVVSREGELLDVEKEGRKDISSVKERFYGGCFGYVYGGSIEVFLLVVASVRQNNISHRERC